MNPSELIDELKKAYHKPISYLIVLILFAVFLSVSAWLTGFWGTRGEQFASNTLHENKFVNSAKDAHITPLRSSFDSKVQLKKSTGFIFNRDFINRDKILGIKIDWKSHKNGIASLKSIDFSTLNKLISEKYIDPTSSQNNSPIVKKFYDFLEIHKIVKATGYAVSPFREDYGVTIDGIFLKRDQITKDLKIVFFEFCKDADDIGTQDDLYCWWD